MEKREIYYFFPIIFDGIRFQFTHGILLHTLFLKLRQCYNEMINNDTKCKQFKHDCREILRNNSDYTFEKSLKINEIFMPDNIFLNLCGFVKNKTA